MSEEANTLDPKERKACSQAVSRTNIGFWRLNGRIFHYHSGSEAHIGSISLISFFKKEKLEYKNGLKGF